MSVLHVNLTSYNKERNARTQSGPAQAFADAPWHERTSSALINTRNSVTELRRLSAAVPGAESGAALHLQKLCDLLRTKLAVSFACVDVFGSQRPCSCTLAASGCAESHLPLGLPRLHTPADATELRVLLPPLGPGPGHNSYSHLSASTLLSAATLSNSGLAGGGGGGATNSCGGGGGVRTSPNCGLPASSGAGGAAAGMFGGRRNGGGGPSHMCSSPSMMGAGGGGGGAVAINPLAAQDRERWPHHPSMSQFDRCSAGERPSAGTGPASGADRSSAAAAFWGADRSSAAGDRACGGSPRAGFFASPRAALAASAAAAASASAGGAYAGAAPAAETETGGGYTCATSLEVLPRHIRRLADQFEAELRSFWVIPLFAPASAGAAGSTAPGTPIAAAPTTSVPATQSPLLRPYCGSPASMLFPTALPPCLRSPGTPGAGIGIGTGVGSPMASSGGGAAASSMHMLQQLPLMPETPQAVASGAGGVGAAVGDAGSGRRVIGLLYLMSSDELLFQTAREPLDQFCRWLSDAVTEGRLELLSDMADALAHAAGPAAAVAAAAAHLSDFFTHRTQGMAEVLAYPAFLPADYPGRAVLMLPPAAHRLVPPPPPPAAAAPATPQAAAVVGGGTARSVAEAAAAASVHGCGEGSGLTSGDVLDSWGGCGAMGFLHGDVDLGAGGLHKAGPGRVPPLQPFSLPVAGTLLQTSLAMGGGSRAQPVRVHGGGAVAAASAAAISPPAATAAVAVAAAIARLPDHVLYGGRDGVYGSAPAKTGPAGPLAAASAAGAGSALLAAAAAARHRRVSDAAAAAAAMSHADVALLPGAPQFVMVGVLRDPAAPPPSTAAVMRANTAGAGVSGGGDREAAAAAVAASTVAAAGGRFALYLSVSESLRKDLVRELQSTLDALLVLLHPVFVSAFGYGGGGGHGANASARSAGGVAGAASAASEASAASGALGTPAADPVSSRQRLAAYLATARVVG
ncbi:hypothetical protein HYH02_001271 [Chlamydomonas schloesseri]|uniref:Uncharacterized protein n=1 Tax=Chlamydomonas schloesseri TaxID=2026947 RepID=A0A836BC85_9CHLO|nr:hypothetical protein HYH02_001271 [Chlamydomonas schloesseri]|eukprot:KAG2454237.1 hypothetical protein HYH02_001271 [Chlamydomonas schloesseri]